MRTLKTAELVAISGLLIIIIIRLLTNPLTNIGVRPTVDGREPLLEVHIFDFDEDIYGDLITVEFCNKIREEREFHDLEALKTQIHQDLEVARDWFHGT